jgi:hypothetical protein
MDNKNFLHILVACDYWLYTIIGSDEQSFTKLSAPPEA